MTFGRVALAGFVGGLAAAAVVLAWRASKETGKSIPASLRDVPTEAQRLAAETRQRATEAANAGWQAFKEKEAELAKRLPGKGADTSMVAEAVVSEAEEAV